MIFQLNLPVLLTPTNYCFQDQVIPPSDRLLVVHQTFTKLDMVNIHGFSLESGFTKIWSPPDLPLLGGASSAAMKCLAILTTYHVTRL